MVEFKEADGIKEVLTSEVCQDIISYKDIIEKITVSDDKIILKTVAKNVDYPRLRQIAEIMIKLAKNILKLK